MPLDLHEVGGVTEARCLEQIPRVRPQHWHLGELRPVAFEMAVVHGVESQQRGEQPYVGLGDRVADQVAPRCQAIGQPVQPVEELSVRALVGLLRAGESTAVDPVVDVAVHHRIDRVDLVPQRRRVELRGTRSVMSLPLHSQVDGHLGEVVGDDGAGGDVDDGRHGDPPGIVRDAGEVRLLQPLDAEHRVDAAGVQVERPAALVVGRAAEAHRHRILQPEEPPDDDRPARPGARTRRDEAVSAGFDRVAVPAVRSDPGADVAGVPLVGKRACPLPGAASAPVLVVGGHRPPAVLGPPDIPSRVHSGSVPSEGGSALRAGRRPARRTAWPAPSRRRCALSPPRSPARAPRCHPGEPARRTLR